MHYPGLGALVSIELRDNTKEAAFRFMDALKLCFARRVSATFLRACCIPRPLRTAIILPARRAEWGIVDGLVRISVGIEKIDDIIADIEQALSVG